jgi:hypothetical protein
MQTNDIVNLLSEILEERGPQTAEQLASQLGLQKKKVNRILYSHKQIFFTYDAKQPPKWDVIESSVSDSKDRRQFDAQRSYLTGIANVDDKIVEIVRSFVPGEYQKTVSTDISVHRLSLKNRTRNVLRRQGIRSLAELTSQSATSVLVWPGAGTATLLDITRGLHCIGLRLGMPAKATEVDPEMPGVDPEMPGVDPEMPGVDPEMPGVDELIEYLLGNPGVSLRKCADHFGLHEDDLENYLTQEFETNRMTIRRKIAEVLCNSLSYSLLEFETHLAESAIRGKGLIESFINGTRIPTDDNLAILCTYYGVEKGLPTTGVELAKKIEKDLPNLRARLAVTRRYSGRSLADIGVELGVTRERVRQIIEREIGRERASRNAIQIEFARHRISELQGQIETPNKPFPIPGHLSAAVDDLLGRDKPSTADSETLEKIRLHVRGLLEALPGMNESEVLVRTGLTSQQLWRIDPSGVGRLTLRDRAKPLSRWTDAELLELLRKAATYHFPLSGPKWDQLVALGEIDGPSAQLVFKRFGSWTRACELAGVEFVEGVRSDYGRLWSTRDLEEIVVEYLLREQSKGTLHDFENWLSTKDGYPSLPTVRNYLGPWSVMKQTALLSPTMRRRLGDD